MTPTLRIGGWLSATGAFGLVITNIFYALGLAATPAPMHAYDFDAAIAGAIAAAPMLKAAGTVGIFGDLVWAAAGLVLAQEFGRLGRPLASVGWNLLVLAVILFFFVDGMTGFVLPQLAAAHRTEAFEAFRYFWDVLFLLCVFTFAAATAVIAIDNVRDPALLPRLNAGAMLLVGAVGALTSVAGIAEILRGDAPLYAIPGSSIGVGAALLIPVSLRIARNAAPA